MKREPVQSRMIAALGYDPATNVLELEYVSGEVYQYFAVPASVVSALLSCDRIGAFIGAEIKPRYSFRQIGDELPRGTVRRRER